MSKKILQFTVIFLAILIIACFIVLIVGVYIKFSSNQNISDYKNQDYSLSLKDNEKIIDIEVINDNHLLIIISNNIDKFGIIYNIKDNKIKSKIKR